MPITANKMRDRLKHLDITIWPKQKQDLAEFEIDIRNTCIEEFHPLLNANGVDIDERQNLLA